MERESYLDAVWEIGELIARALVQSSRRITFVIKPGKSILSFDDQDRIVFGSCVLQLDPTLQTFQRIASQQKLLGSFLRSVSQEGTIRWQITFGRAQNQDVFGELISLLELMEKQNGETKLKPSGLG